MLPNGTVHLVLTYISARQWLSSPEANCFLPASFDVPWPMTLVRARFPHMSIPVLPLMRLGYHALRSVPRLNFCNYSYLAGRMELFGYKNMRAGICTYLCIDIASSV